MGHRTLVLFKTKYGSTEQYARWIHEEVGGDLVFYKRGKKVSFEPYDRIVLGGPIHGGRVTIATVLRDRWDELKHKDVSLFVVGATPIEHPKFLECYETSVSPEIREHINYFPLRGRLDQSRLDMSDRFLMHVAVWIETDPFFKEGMQSSVDGVARENLNPLLEHLRKLEAVA